MEIWVRATALEIVRSDPKLVCTVQVESRGFTDGLNLG